MSAPSPSPAEAPTTARFVVGGMHCESCTALIEESLGDHPGVSSVTVDLETGVATVGFDPSRVGTDDLAGLIVEAGYTASPTG